MGKPHRAWLSSMTSFFDCQDTKIIIKFIFLLSVNFYDWEKDGEW